jgi:hypothetical protein
MGEISEGSHCHSADAPQYFNTSSFRTEPQLEIVSIEENSPRNLPGTLPGTLLQTGLFRARTGGQPWKSPCHGNRPTPLPFCPWTRSRPGYRQART